MRLGIMQPYFFPYLNYFTLIKNTDSFILIDSVQYIRHGWINRNRILKGNEGWSYINVPLAKHHRETLIKDIVISENQDWRNRILNQLTVYKSKAPYYNEVTLLVNECLKFKDSRSITDFNLHCLQTICEYLGLSRNIQIFTKMNIDIPEIDNPDEWSLQISKALGAEEYWNLSGGIDFFDGTKFSNNNISLKFIKNNLPVYDQSRQSFENGLSIIDVLMWNSPEEACHYLDDYTILTSNNCNA